MSVEAALVAKYKKVRKSNAANGLEYIICCPLCHTKGKSPDTRFKMYINPAKYGGVFNCYRCGSSGRMSFLLGSDYQDAAPRQKAEVPLDSVKVVSPGSLVPVDQLDADHPAIVYLTRTRRRSFDPVTLSTYYNVSYCPEGRFFGNGENFLYHTGGTLVFPIYFNEKYIGWQSRMLIEPKDLPDEYLEAYGFPKDDEGEWVRPPKYYTSPGFPKGRGFYYWDVAKTRNPVVVGEGVFDAIAAGVSGIAALGKGLTDHQVDLLKTYCDHVIIALDPDASKEARKLIQKLRRVIKVTELDVTGFGDIGDMGTELIWQRIAAQQAQDHQAVSRALNTE